MAALRWMGEGMRKASVVSAALAVLFVSTACRASECKAAALAPSVFPTTRDGSIAPAGFVGLRSGEAVVHGVDVSKWQNSTDFLVARECGARFSYIRLSGGTDDSNEHMYRIHWPNAVNAQLLVGPYHQLSILPKGAKKWLSADDEKKAPLLADLMKQAAWSGRHQARNFLANLNEMLGFGIRGVASRSYLPIALDISFRNDPLIGAANGDYMRFGDVAAKAACAFISTIRANRATKGVEIILFADPRSYQLYGLNRSHCGLNKMSVWVRLFTHDGDKFDGPSASAEANSVRYLCGGKPSRCIFQQYTSAGGFALSAPGGALDLDRFFGTYEALTSLLQRY